MIKLVKFQVHHLNLFVYSPPAGNPISWLHPSAYSFPYSDSSPSLIPALSLIATNYPHNLKICFCFAYLAPLAVVFYLAYLCWGLFLRPCSQYWFSCLML